MKKACLPGFIWIGLLIVTNSVFSQGNFPFPSTYAEWGYHTVQPLIGPTDLFYYHKNILSGDSVFMGKHYTKLYGATLCSCDCGSVNGTYKPSFDQTYHLYGGIREDSGKVYYTHFGAPPFNDFYRPVVDTLLFDFTLQQDDTIHYAEALLVVTGVEINAEGRRVINIKGQIPLKFPKGFQWVEGIGGPYGPLETIYYLRDYIYYDGTSCFAQDQPGHCAPPCAVSTGTDSPENQEDISIYPSFAQDFVTVSVDKSFGRYRLDIYANDGRLLRSFTSESSSFQAPVAEFSAGILHFVCENASGRRISKTYVH